MMGKGKVVYGSPFKIDWTNLNAVIEYCKKFGPECIVTKSDDRPNYNICIRERRDTWDIPGVTVVFDELKN